MFGKGGNMKDITTAELAIVISAGSALISLISAITSIYYNSRSQKQYNISLDPALSFKLLECKGILYLQITNTGKSAAREIEITINSIENNGSRQELLLDSIFNDKFELFAGETTQGAIGLWGENVVEHTFPKVLINVQYKKQITKKKVAFSRTVIFCPAYREKVYADVNMDLREISSNIATIARADLRTANYLDGCQVAPFDELNILAHKSLHDDMLDIQKRNDESNIVSRETTIMNCIRKLRDQKHKGSIK